MRKKEAKQKLVAGVVLAVVLAVGLFYFPDSIEETGVAVELPPVENLTQVEVPSEEIAQNFIREN